MPFYIGLINNYLKKKSHRSDSFPIHGLSGFDTGKSDKWRVISDKLKQDSDNSVQSSVGS